MRLSALQFITYAIADAMLAGPPEPDAVTRRIGLALGDSSDWMRPVARLAVQRFGARWDAVTRSEVATLVAGAGYFVAAWRSENPPRVVRVLRRAPVQGPPPPRIRHIALPQLPTSGELAGWLNIAPAELDWFADRWRVPAQRANTPLHHYAYKAVEKRDGRCRVIEIPKPRLRGLQRQVLHGLLDRVPVHEAVHGFRRGRNAVSFATPHVGKAVVLRLDLTDFFASVNGGRVYSVFRGLGFPKESASTLTALCTNRVPSGRLLEADLRERIDWRTRRRYQERHLPQGAPTSPALANLCAFRLDVRLAGLAESVGATYTRYADDLAFSGDEALARMAERLAIRIGAIALEEGFELNFRKTRVMRHGARQHLAGVVVNQHANVARPAFDALKALLTNCVRHGPASQNREGHRDFKAHVAGRVAHVTMVNAARGEKLKALYERIEWEAAGEASTPRV